MKRIGCNSMVDPLRRVIMKGPNTAWQDINKVKNNWKDLHFSSEPIYDKAITQYNELITLIELSLIHI